MCLKKNKFSARVYDANNENCNSAVVIDFPENLPYFWEQIHNNMEKKGWCILGLKDSTTETLIQISKYFGQRQKSYSADAQGIANIINKPLNNEVGQVISSDPFVPHTDGHYLNGFTFFEDKVRRIKPPKFILLQCVTPAQTGGESLLVDGKNILIDLMKEPKILSILFSRCINIHHNDILVSDLAVFSPCGSSTYSIRWSYDKELYFSKKIENTLNVFNREYISNVKYSVKKKMLPHQILIIDNKRILHGREEVFGERFYRRVWIYDDEASELLSNAKSPILYKTHRPHTNALIALQNFNPIEKERNLKLKNPIPSGIVLNSEMECKLRELISKNYFDTDINSSTIADAAAVLR